LRFRAPVRRPGAEPAGPAWPGKIGGDLVTLFLAGDVMLGRGVDQILPYPGDPKLSESYIKDPRAYVDLAEAANGMIPLPVDFPWPWGDALDVLDAAAPDARILNLETAVTQNDETAPGKEIQYRMHPANLPGLAAARPHVCVLANTMCWTMAAAGWRRPSTPWRTRAFARQGRGGTPTRPGVPRSCTS